MWRAIDDSFRELPVTRLLSCMDNVRALAAGPRKGVLTVATGCSGTDLVIGVLDMLSKYFEDRWGAKIVFQHRFSCDCKHAAQKFILQHWSPELFFRRCDPVVGLSVGLAQRNNARGACGGLVGLRFRVRQLFIPEPLA